MSKEYEHAFYDFNKEDIISKIKELKGEYKGIYLFRVQIFIHPLNTLGTYIRIRDEGYRITMTYKMQKSNDVYREEDEIIINDFDIGVAILLGLGCTKKYYYEKIREIWTIKDPLSKGLHPKNTEIVFDSNPGVDDRMEIESKTLKELKEMIKYFGLEIIDVKDRYNDLFGIIIPKTMDLTFIDVKKDLIGYVTKNKKNFITLVNNQLKKYKNIKKSIKK